MSLRFARRIADGVSFLDPVSDAVQRLVLSVPAPVRDLLDGVWLGAPLHPALTDVPLGSWTAAFFMDAVDTVSGSRTTGKAADGALAIGVAAALPAAATGLNDWSHLRGDAKRIGTVHALLNSAGLALNVASLVCRLRGRRGRARALSTAAYGGALVSAHLGGLLSFGLGVRVNATAGAATGGKWTDVLAEDELGGALQRVEVDGEPVLLTRSSSGRPCAISARCSHLGGPLDQGDRDGDAVTCPWHGSRFDLCTGRVLAGPAVFPQPRYETRVRKGRVELRREPR